MLKNKIGLELVWWITTIVITCLLLLPIYTKIGDSYPFYLDNILIIVLSITFCRYIFLLKYHWPSYRRWIKVVFIFVPIPIFFFLIGAVYDFQAFTDEKGLQSVMGDLRPTEQVKLSKYIRTEMLLFWSTAFLANAFMPLRMIKSIYSEIKSGTH